MLSCHQRNSGSRSWHQPPMLSKREQECLTLVAQGVTTHGIAKQLGISHRTVDHHIASVMTKLAAPTRAAAVARAIAQNFIQLDDLL